MLPHAYCARSKYKAHHFMIVLSNIINFKCVSQHRDVSQVQGSLHNVPYKLDLQFPCRIREVV